MAHMGRPGLSAAQKADLCQRWKQGLEARRMRRFRMLTERHQFAPAAPNRVQ